MMKLQEIYELYTKYNSVCNFIVIYLQEAHSSDGWNFKWNQEREIDILYHKKIDDKINACNQMIDIWKDEVAGIDKAIELNKFKIVCDDIDCNVDQKFNATPERIIILDKDNTVAVKGAYGPLGFNTGIVDKFLSDK